MKIILDMALIQKSDLKYDYNWSTNPASKSRNFTTESETKSKLFSSNDGKEILSFINEYAESNNIVTKEEAIRIESLLREKLRDERMTRGEIKAWLDGFFKSKKN